MFVSDHPVESRILSLMIKGKKNSTVLDHELYAVFEWFFGNEYSRRDFYAALTWLNQQSLISCNYYAPDKGPPTLVQITHAGRLLADENPLQFFLS